jgi:hypothetical protein
MKAYYCIAVVLVCGFLFGCQKQPAQANNEPSPPDKTEIEKKPFTVKGFYIGMPRESVNALLDSYKLANRSDHPQQTIAMYYDAALHLERPGRISIVYNHNLITRIDMDSGMINQLFNVVDLDLKAFAEEFQKNYNLPEMDPITSGLYGWHYRDENEGFEVAIYSQQYSSKSLCIMQIPKSKERKFD